MDGVVKYAERGALLYRQDGSNESAAQLLEKACKIVTRVIIIMLYLFITLLSNWAKIWKKVKFLQRILNRAARKKSVNIDF